MGSAASASLIIAQVSVAVYAYRSALNVTADYDGAIRHVVAGVAAVMVALLVRVAWIRRLMRWICFGHAVLGLALIHLWVNSYGEGVVLYAIDTILLPAAVGLFLLPEPQVAKAEDLPVGYEHLARTRGGLKLWHKPLVLAGIATLLPVLLGFNTVLFVVVLLAVPIAFVVWHLNRMATVHKSRAPELARRIRERAGGRKPEQEGRYWTIDSSGRKREDRSGD